MANTTSEDEKKVMFEAASLEVVKQIGRKSLHPVPDLHVCQQYALYKIIRIDRSRLPWKRAEYMSLNIDLNTLMGCCKEKAGTNSLDVSKDELVTIKARTSSTNMGCLQAEAKVERFIKVRRRSQVCCKSKIQLDLGPLQAEKAADLVALQRWTQTMKINYRDGVLYTVKKAKEDYVNKNRLNTLAVVTSIYRLTKEGRLQQEETEEYVQSASAAVTVKEAHIKAEMGSEHHTDTNDQELLKIPAGTIIAYGVNELNLDDLGNICVIQDTHTKGRFMRDMFAPDVAGQELCIDEDEEEDIQERDVWELLDDDTRGLLRDLISSPDLVTVCTINNDPEKDRKNIKTLLANANLSGSSLQILKKLGISFVNDVVQINDEDSLKEPSRVLSFVISAIDELTDAQVAAVMKLNLREATAAVDKVLKEKLFIEPGLVDMVPDELYSKAGRGLLKELGFELKGEGCLLMDHTTEETQCELIAARILLKAFNELPPGCGAETPMEWPTMTPLVSAC